VLAVNFFPVQNPYIGILSALAVMGVGYLARPVGGLLFGRMGDLMGRQRTFVMTIVLMGVSTTVMGLLPTYQSVGILAPALLVTLRLIQGLAYGGEYVGGSTYVAEFSPDNRRGVYVGAVNQMTQTIGTLMGAAVIFVVIYYLGNDAMTSYGWRIVFLLSLVLLFLGLYMRVKLTETPAFHEIREARKLSKEPIKETLKMNWKQMILLIVGFQGGVSVLAYSTGLTGAPIIFMTMIMRPRVSLALASGLTVIGNLVSIPFLPFFGWVSDKIRSRKKVIYPAMLVEAITLYPLYSLISYGGIIGNVATMAAAMIIMTIIHTATSSATGAFWTELFPTRVRYVSYGLGNSVAVAIFGGFTPLIVAAIVDAAGGQFLVGLLWPIMFSIFSAIIGILFVRETHCKLTVA
jgi:MFS family permease